MNDHHTPPPPPPEQPDTTVEPADSPTDGPDKEARTMGMLAHLAALAGFVGIPLGNVIGPLIVWLIKKDEVPFVDDQGKEAVNFQITVTLAVLLCLVLTFATCGIGIFITGPLMVGIGIIALVFTIIAAVKANEGVYYRYPVTYRFIK